MNKAFAFGNQEDLDTTYKLIDAYGDFNSTPYPLETDTEQTIFAKVVELRAGSDDKQCTAVEVVYNATNKAFEAPEGTAWTFNVDNIANDYTTTDLFSSEALEVDEVVEVFLYPDKSESEQWMARKSGANGSSLVYVEITASTSISEYTATIFDNPTDRVSVEAGVTVYAKQHDAGTIPNSASGKGLWAMTGNDDKYYLTNYSVFYG